MCPNITETDWRTRKFGIDGPCPSSYPARIQLRRHVAEHYRSENLLVRAIPAENQRLWVVTFDNYGAPTTFDRFGFGEEFFTSRGISFVTVLSAGNDWYQHPDTPIAMQVVRSIVSGAERVMTYGSSMGAYAAIRFADAIGADACLALSPQYSNDRKKVPFERRWPQEAAAIEWRAELERTIRCQFRPVVVYDPRDSDDLHARLIASEIPITALPVPYAGHPVTTYLSAAHALERLVLDVLNDRLDVHRTREDLINGRTQNSVYLSELARRQPNWRPLTGIALARKALELSPDSELMLHILAKRLTSAGKHDEALPYHSRAVELSNGFIGYALPYSEALAAAGYYTEARNLAQVLTEENPQYAQFHSWYGHLLRLNQEYSQALHHASEAARLSPTNPHYSLARDTYKAELDGKSCSIAVANLRFYVRIVANFLRRHLASILRNRLFR